MAETRAEIDDNIARDYGFKDHAELLELKSRVDLTDDANIEAFRRWLRLDGHKAGLMQLKLLPKKEKG